MNSFVSTVLVIEDDHSVAELIACFLAHAKLRPVIAPDGAAGLLQARALLPDLIFCDSCMPGLSGMEVIEKLRSEPATALIPVILMSGHAAERFDGSGANAFLQKPFRMTEMLALTERFVCEQSSVIADEIGHAAECGV